MEMRRFRCARRVPSKPKLIIRGPIAEPSIIISAAKPIVKEVIIASEGLK